MSGRRTRSFFDLFREIEAEMERSREDLMMKMKELELRTGCVMPLYNIVETPTEVAISFDMPGTRKEDIKVNLCVDSVSVSASCRKHVVRAGPDFRLGEKHRHEYRLTLKLPSAVDPEKTRAVYKAGVLEITAPKRWVGKEIQVE